MNFLTLSRQSYSMITSRMKEMHRRDVYDTLQLLKIWSLSSEKQSNLDFNPTGIEKQWDFFYSCICAVTKRILLLF